MTAGGFVLRALLSTALAVPAVAVPAECDAADGAQSSRRAHPVVEASGSSGSLERASSVRAGDTLSRRPRFPDASHPGFRPIRTNTPGTGVFIGSGVVARVLWDRRSGAGLELETLTSLLDVRYTPATHWVFGVELPWILTRELRGTGTGDLSASGPAAPRIGAKHRFLRTVGRWSDRHAAVAFEVDLPFGRRGSDAGRSLDPLLRDRLRPATGATDWSAELIYQEGRRRFVYGGDLSFRRSGRAPDGYRRGNEIRFDFDLEYIVLPLDYRRPGDEVFLLLEGSLLRHRRDELEGGPVEESGRSELLLAPGIQHVATEQTLLSVSFQFPAWHELGARELERDFNLLFEVRHAF